MEVPPQDPSIPTAEELLRECRMSQDVHPKLLAEVERRNVTPSWAKRFDEQREDWLKELHHAVTREGWDVLDAATAGVVERGQFLGMAAAAKAIVIPISTPGYLHALLDLLAKPMVHPDSVDPEAKMLWDPLRAQQALGEFRLMLGMLRETNYLEAPHMNDAWKRPVIAATRFIYYHELGHVAHAQAQDHRLPCWLTTSELEDPVLPYEMVADQLALSMLLLEFRNHKDLLIPGMAGVVLALGLITMKAYVEPDGPEMMYAVKRMNRLFDWAEKAKLLGDCTDEAITMAKHFWNSLFSYFGKLEGNPLPSPIYSLLRQTSEQPKSVWPAASGHVLKWCAYGNRAQVLTTLRSIRDQAVAQAGDEKAKGVLEVIGFLVDDLRDVDPILGLRESLHL